MTGTVAAQAIEMKIEHSEILRQISDTAIEWLYYIANRVFLQVFIPQNDFEKKIELLPP